MTWVIKAGCMGKRKMSFGHHTGFSTDLSLFSHIAERQAAEYLLSFFPDIELTLEDYLSQRNRLQDERWSSVKLLPGVYKLVQHLRAHGIPIAVATGSRRRNYELKIAHLQTTFSCFEGKVICGDDTHHNIRGKPAPDIFIAAAKELLYRDVGSVNIPITDKQRIERGKGLVFEDALPGLQAGKRAGMSGSC